MHWNEWVVDGSVGDSTALIRSWFWKKNIPKNDTKIPKMMGVLENVSIESHYGYLSIAIFRGVYIDEILASLFGECHGFIQLVLKQSEIVYFEIGPIDQQVFNTQTVLLILSKACRDVDSTNLSLMESQMFSDSA